jgi:hypothetical protein
VPRGVGHDRARNVQARRLGDEWYFDLDQDVTVPDLILLGLFARCATCA